MKWNDFVLEVAEISQLTKNLIRVEFTVDPDSGLGYELITPGDEAIAFYFSSDGTALRTKRSDDPSALGGWELIGTAAQDGAEEVRTLKDVPARNYTVRSYDGATGRMVVDIAEHGHGPAIDWIRAAQPGWQLLAAGPRSWYSPPEDASRHVLAADLAALPALARILENTPEHIEVTVVAEVLDRSDLTYLPDRPNTEVVELVGTGNGASPSVLAEALRTVDLPADAYLWLAGEAAATRAAKKIVRALGWPRNRGDVVGYWRQDAEAWLKRFEQSDPEKLRAVYADALAAGKSPGEAVDIYEKALEEAGL